MKDILITVISILLTVVIIICMVKGLTVGSFRILSISNIKQESLNKVIFVKRLNVTVQCMAVYNSSIEVPDGMALEEAVDYAKDHLDEIPCGELEFSDSDELDEENCDFEE